MIYSGLDWSGSPGTEQGPWLVFAVVHLDQSDLPALDAALATARTRLGFDPGYLFKHTRAKRSNAIHDRFYEALRPVDFAVRVLMMDKVAWGNQHAGRTRAADSISDGIVELVLGCPDHVVARQVLYIDLPASEEKSVQTYRTAIRRALAGVRRTGFRDVRPCPDHRQQGGIIQVADMLAGEVREQEGLLGPYLPTLSSRIRLV